MRCSIPARLEYRGLCKSPPSATSNCNPTPKAVYYCLTSLFLVSVISFKQEGVEVCLLEFCVIHSPTPFL
ncbi:hypothetical protein NECAME_00874 [Necator americanus]|uniref:Uncharacterized protein n=1 Tax=Necator americanus TaxID=51031 RepID=W2SNE9_NECAM|nr:hypothetical protein NECAME_00874 [Necator americanus]ETN71185.1 hypothetical protein NECAME_00874 [Necator americanus]